MDANETELARLRAAIAHLEHEVEAAAEHFANKGKGGMRVPFHGDFVNVTPSTLSRLQWHVRNLKGK